MLADRIPQWIRESQQRGEAIGEASGETKGEAKTLLKLLNLKFGPLSDNVKQQVNSANIEQLDLWVDQVLPASSSEDIFLK